MDIKNYIGVDINVGDTYHSNTKQIDYKVDYIDFPKELISFKKNGLNKASKLSFSFVQYQLSNKNWIKK